MPHSFNGNRLRKGRFSAAGHIYALTVVTAQRNPFFYDWPLGRQVVLAFRSAHEDGMVRSIAWVIMPDHFHWLIELQRGSLSEVMCRVKSRSSSACKRRMSHDGPVWQKGFHDRALRSDEDLRAVARYIVANPLRAGLVGRVADYPLWDADWV